jgi:hypothetical protein
MIVFTEEHKKAASKNIRINLCGASEISDAPFCCA